MLASAIERDGNCIGSVMAGSVEKGREMCAVLPRNQPKGKVGLVMPEVFRQHPQHIFTLDNDSLSFHDSSKASQTG